MPLSIMESMALGRPVVASKVGGVPELLGGGGGVMVPASDAPALANAICELATDPERRSALGAEARAIAERRFSIEAIADRTTSLFRRIATTKRRPIPFGDGGAEHARDVPG